VREGIRTARIPERDLHARDRDVELFGHDLDEAGPGALTELVEAGEERDGVVGVDREPRVDLREVGRQVRNLGGGPGEAGACEAEADDERAAALEERLAGELPLVQEAGHPARPPSPSETAAASRPPLVLLSLVAIPPSNSLGRLPAARTV